MAISTYGRFKPQRRRFTYYIVAAIIVAVAAIIFFYPFSEKEKTNNIAEPVKTETSPVQPASNQNIAVQKPSQQQTMPSTASFSSVVSDANAQAGPRVVALLKDAESCIAEGRIIAARNTLNDVLNMNLDNNLRNRIKSQMTNLANDWLFSKTVHFGDNLCSTYKVQPGDMLSSIAANLKVPYQFIMKINNIPDEKSLRSGQVLKVVHGPFHGIVYLSSFTMDLYLQNIYVKSYKVGTGKPGHETPPGLWRAKVGGKLIKPTWTDPETGKTYHSDDPDYPLGSGWIALDGIDSRTRGIEGIAIHGTKDEDSIGTKSSRGCLRLYNGELTELYDMFEQGFSELRVVE